MRIVFFGTAGFSCKCLEALLENNENVVGVICQPDKESGRGHVVSCPKVKIFANHYHIPVLQYESVKKSGAEDIKALKPDLLVVAAFGQMISQEILDIALTINVHGSLLPAYRGASPIQTAILNGDTETGITIMRVVYEMDAGDIILQEKLQILPEDNSETLFEKMSDLGGKVLIKAIKQIKNKTVKFIPQDASKATFTKRLNKENAKMDFSKSATQLFNEVRGYNPFPVSFFCYKGIEYKVFSAKVITDLNGKIGEVLFANSKQGLVVKCGQDALEILEIQAPNGKRMLAKAFVNCGKIKQGDLID